MLETERLIHIRFEGKSADLPLVDLGINGFASDEDIKAALARHFDVAVSKFDHYVVERHATGHITVRPEAIFGS
jgi:hypothetical protein